MTSVSVQSKIMRREKTPGEFDLYRAALEWDLIDPIVIESRDDLKSEEKWKGSVNPYHHQVTNLITFCRRLPVTLLADDVGLGKTISAGLIVSELESRARVRKVLVVCPKILGPQWKEELETKFGIEAQVVVGSDLKRADPKDGGAIITTYASARLHLDKIPKDRFQMLILDEAHKLRNLFGVATPPQVALTFKAALEERRFPYVLMLTATPIQNRLWDLYSLVELLSVARGHQNPFGSPGIFARKFIADDREKARQLRAEAKDEFRSIVYGYMSRVRRGDAQLYFPDRVVQMHKILPSQGELALIQTIAKPIQSLSILAQISILQALASSPEALSAQLQNMAAKGTIKPDLALSVREIVRTMPTAAKLKGLGKLIERLRADNPQRWRVVIFTTRRETQTTIEAYLSAQGIKVGTINGSTGALNQSLIREFRKDPPTVNVIVSTEAGSEGVNLQAANVLVNYDLPWNPMIVEQRIGRVQRLASQHKSVAIFNVMLQGTFEEYIVGRLMEKLQMAAHAIGDIESLLEASGVGDEDDASSSFEEKIRELVVASLAGIDVSAKAKLEAESLERAIETLAEERENIASMLGDMQGAQDVGPRAPTLPPPVRSLAFERFVAGALELLGGKLIEHSEKFCRFDINGPRTIFFDRELAAQGQGELYVPGSANFARLVDRVVATGVHRIEDLDEGPEASAATVAKEWTASFGAAFQASNVSSVDRLFEGSALVRVRATVQPDSYERLVEVRCPAFQRKTLEGRRGLSPLPHTLEDIVDAGLDEAAIAEAAQQDEAIAEFCRFYLERREDEAKAAGDDERKRAKILDDFTPRLHLSIVGLQGAVRRSIRARTVYKLEGAHTYDSELEIDPGSGTLMRHPELRLCKQTGRSYPVDCLGRCDITGVEVLRHHLVSSEFSDRVALREHGVRCAFSGKIALADEVEASAATGEVVAKSLLHTSALSGLRAEPDQIGECAFSGAKALLSELATSEISGKLYRADEKEISEVSGKSGHREEFESCYETRQRIARIEAEKCEETGRRVRPGLLETCGVTGRKVLPSELGTCVVTGTRALKRSLVASSVSGVTMLEALAIRASNGQACLPSETARCAWSGNDYHPQDVGSCGLTGLPITLSHLASQGELRALREMLDGLRHNAELPERWPEIASRMSLLLRGAKCRIEAASLSPSGDVLAVRCEARTMLGIRTNHAGALYSLKDNAIVGRISVGKATARGWAA